MASVADGGTTAYCPVPQAGQPAGDAFPDDIAPGDVIDVTGVSDSYIPASCSAADAGPGSSMIPSVQLNKVTVVTPSGTKATPPTPHVLSNWDIATLAAGGATITGSDAGSGPDWLNQWGNVRVTLDNVTAVGQGTNNAALTDQYGHMLLQDGIEVGDSVYYVGYVKATDACYSGPVYTPPVNFSSLTGFVYLDYCNWSIQPSSKCADLNPPSPDCLGAVTADGGSNDDGGDSDAGVSDAGPNQAQVCTH
jgi:hypothetical protein